MKIDIWVRPGADHQAHAAQLLTAGLARHGDEARIVSWPEQPKADVVACWGWRHGAELARPPVQARGRPGRRVLVIERGYVGPRAEWTSLGWDGLNGRARFPLVDDGGERWRACFPGALKPEVPAATGSYALIMGQIEGDASLSTGGAVVDIRGWYRQAAGFLGAITGLPVVIRQHPVDLGRRGRPADGTIAGIPILEGSFEEALAGARCVAAYNSNALTGAALAGVPILAEDPGAMAWPVAGHGLESVPQLQQRESWAHRLAWTQWRDEEIADGTAWDLVRDAMDPDGARWAAAFWVDSTTAAAVAAVG